MSQTWPKYSHEKLHENCGGRVRWVEALDTPGVHYTGHCLHCDRDGIPMERIIAIEFGKDLELRNAIREMPLDERADLSWDDDADWAANQTRLIEAVT